VRHIINISLPLELKREVDKAVKQEKYATKSEFFRALLRMWQRQKTVKIREEEIDLFGTAVQSGVFNFYQNEPDIYSEQDIKEWL